MSGLEPGPESGLAGDSSPSHPSMRALVDSSVSSYLSPRPLYSTPSVQSSDSVHTSDSTPAVPPEPLFRTTPMTPNEAQMLEDHAQWSTNPTGFCGTSRTRMKAASRSSRIRSSTSRRSWRCSQRPSTRWPRWSGARPSDAWRCGMALALGRGAVLRRCAELRCSTGLRTGRGVGVFCIGLCTA